MKKFLLLSVLFLGSSFLLSGLQSSLYFFPLSIPAFWFIIFSYYSFKKSLLFTLAMNIIHALVIASFATPNLGQFLILLNLLSLAFYMLREHFHTNHWHISLASSAGFVFLMLACWFFSLGSTGWVFPNVLSWLGTATTTLIAAPPIIFLLDHFDKQIEYERVDTLENLRI